LYHATLLFPPDGPASEQLPLLVRGLLRCTHQLWIGVPVFFVISGYCISATADSTRRRPKLVGTYFLRRFRRIYPPYWAAIVFCALAVFFLDYQRVPGLLSSEPWPQFRPWWFSASQWLGNLTLTETWRHYLFGSPRGHFVGQSWTLCYEEQFYAIVGLILWLAPRRFFLAAIGFTALAVLVQAAAGVWGWAIDGFFFDGQWLLFAAGILVYHRINYASRRQAWAWNVLLGVAALHSLIQPRLWPQGAFAGLTFALAISLLQPWDLPLAGSTAARPLRFLGTICYSLYLTHSVVVRAIARWHVWHGAPGDSVGLLLNVAISVAAALAVGWLFYLAVERRFLNARPAVAAPSAVPPGPKVRSAVGYPPAKPAIGGSLPIDLGHARRTAEER